MFLRAVKLYNSGDFRGSTEDMERALAEYLVIFARCLAGCEGAHEQVDFKDFYPSIAGTPPKPMGHPSQLPTTPCFPELFQAPQHIYRTPTKCLGSVQSVSRLRETNREIDPLPLGVSKVPGYQRRRGDIPKGSGEV